LKVSFASDKSENSRERPRKFAAIFEAGGEESHDPHNQQPPSQDQPARTTHQPKHRANSKKARPLTAAIPP
jgi:hypothetical protein